MSDWTYIVHTCQRCGASWHAPRDKPHECEVLRLQKRIVALEGAIAVHRRERFDTFMGPNSIDKQLYAARDAAFDAAFDVRQKP